MQERLRRNTQEATELIFHALRYDGPINMKVRNIGISCFAVRSFINNLIERFMLSQQNWVFYALRSKNVEPEELRYLRALVQPALEYCLPHSDEAVDIFVDILSSYRSFFQNQHLQAISLLLRSQWGQSQLDDLIAGSALSIQFGRLVLAFAECNVEELFNAPTDPNSVDIMCKFNYFL